MVTYISSWARQVIVSVVVAIILEMILSPNSKSTKYIKTVIGIYVVYAIIAPALNLIGGKNLDFSNIDYETYFASSDIYQNLESNVKEIENTSFEETYKMNLKQDIENKLLQKGVTAKNIKLEVDLEQNSEEYAKITSIEISLTERKDSKNDKESNQISVNKINVEKSSVSTQGTDAVTQGNLTPEKESEIKEFISQEYGIDKNNILIR